MEEVDVDGQEGLTMTPDETSQTIKPKTVIRPFIVFYIYCLQSLPQFGIRNSL